MLQKRESWRKWGGEVRSEKGRRHSRKGKGERKKCCRAISGGRQAPPSVFGRGHFLPARPPPHFTDRKGERKWFVGDRSNNGVSDHRSVAWFDGGMRREGAVFQG